MNGVIDVLVSIASTPAFLVALIALIGLLAQRKTASDTVKGVVKTFVGFLVLGAGADFLVGALNPFGSMFEAAFNVKGVVPNNEAIISQALVEYGTTTALIMFFGMIVNILIAAFTRFKHIFLTGHHTLYMAAMLAVVFTVAGLRGPLLIGLAALALGAVMSLSPWLLQRYMNRLTGQQNKVGLGHFAGVSYFLGGLLGDLLKPKSGKVKSTEDVNFPKGLAFLRDSTVAIALTMMIVYVVVALAAGPTVITEQQTADGGAATNYVVYALTLGGKFAAGVFIILAGVRLILNEIVPAFKGISEKIVPNAIPALDCPIVFPYAPNAVLIGFLVSFAAGVVSMFIMGAAGMTVVIPGVVPHFFLGATTGVMGNATGGIRGAIAGAALNGVIISFLPLFLLPVLGDLGFAATTFSDTDFILTGMFFGNLAKIGTIGVVIGLVVVYALMIGWTIFAKVRKPKDAETVSAS
ncbi:PTS ascorbate transporter subunit IIC [Enemella sp. A6]|uniref:PTS ascorbate transporter subunit IIC n=1 Tax=Enemella sp. A6 TaxID=3440152 RepID=UPI003EBFC566